AVLVLRHGARHASRQAEALRESEARRLRALNGSSDGFFEWDLRRRQAYLSPRFEHLLGHPPGALTTDVAIAQALLHPDDRAGARAALKAHLQDGKPYDVELRMRHADGAWRWLRSRASADRGPNGDELRLSGSISDVTERRHAEDELRRREVQFRSLWETTSDAVLILDAEGRVAFANPAAHTLFGYAPGTLVGQPMAQLQPVPQRAEFAGAMSHYQTTGERHFDWLGTETIGLHHDGHPIPLEVRISEFTLDGQRQFVGFLRDISQRKAAEQALLDANDRLEHHVAARTSELTQANERLREVDRLKSEFLATMSHELRTPLNSVLGFTSILLSGQPGPLNDEQKRQLGFVHGSGHHLLQLINDLLDLSRIESGYLELVRTDFDVAALVADVCDQLQPMADAKGLTLARTVPPTLTLRSDRRRAYQVLLNLVNNALKFTAQGEVRIEVERAGRELLLRVHDTGIGIAAAALAGLFQPFRQVDNSLARTHEGTGLGLYLSRRLTELMGGRISVESTPGQGSCFTVSLPLPQVEDSRRAAETRTTMLR
ncbi:MAG: PAS domain S-box protein, partial [Rubrivivax sp.]